MRFSIVTAVFNNKELVESAVESVHSQVGVEVEHIIMDGGSTDGTLDLLKKFTYPNIILESSRDKGIYDALNKGIAKSTGDVVGILHSDDIFSSRQVLSKVASLFEAGVDGVYADLDYVNRVDTTQIFRKWKSGSFNSFDLELGWMPPHPTLFLRKEIYQKMGEFDLQYKIAADYDFMMRVLTTKKYKIAYLPETILKMRVGGQSNKSLKNIIRKSTEDYQIAKKYFQSPEGTILFKNIRKIPQFLHKSTSV